MWTFLLAQAPPPAGVSKKETWLWASRHDLTCSRKVTRVQGSLSPGNQLYSCPGPILICMVTPSMSIYLCTFQGPHSRIWLTTPFCPPTPQKGPHGDYRRWSKVSSTSCETAAFLQCFHEMKVCAHRTYLSGVLSAPPTAKPPQAQLGFRRLY